MSFSFLFPVPEELEYSWPFSRAEKVVREVVGMVVREVAETDDRHPRESLCLQ